MACLSPRDQPPSKPIPPNVPALEPQQLSIADLDEPIDPSIAPGVLPTGRIVFFHPASVGELMGRIVDSTGKSPIEFGRNGAGPSEFRAPLRQFAVGDLAVAVFDAANRRLSIVAIDGKALSSVTVSGSDLPIAVVTDSFDLPEVTGTRVSVSRYAFSGGFRELLSDTNSAVIALFGLQDSKLPSRTYPVLGSSQHRLAVGNEMTYTFVLFDAGGQKIGQFHRDLPTRYRSRAEVARMIASARTWMGARGERTGMEESRAKLEREPMPFFSHVSPAQFDSAGRMWVVGWDADSAFADVYADTTFLRRFPIPCSGFAGRWSLSGRWLAVSCDGSGIQDSLPTFQLFKIKG
jgi:hypothetical protein